jgi:FkbM family methyltransferase
MRPALFYNPRLLCERLAEISRQKRRRRRLRGTPAATLETGHIDSLELLQLLEAKPPRVIYDIGACYGTWTVLVKSIFPDADVHAFEPLRELRDRFAQATASLKNVTHHQIALGATPGIATMELASFLDASSLLRMTQVQTQEFNAQPAGTAEVSIERLDDYVRQNKLTKPDLIKLDVQGYELEVLRGAEECLANASAVISEVSFAEFYKDQCLFEEIVSFLAARGYRTHAFGASTKIGGRILQTDALFERNAA